LIKGMRRWAQTKRQKRLKPASRYTPGCRAKSIWPQIKYESKHSRGRPKPKEAKNEIKQKTAAYLRRCLKDSAEIKKIMAKPANK